LPDFVHRRSAAARLSLIDQAIAET